MRDRLIRDFTDIYDRYLKDESSEEGTASSISFPHSAEEVSEIIRHLNDGGDPDYTVQGGLSGIRGDAVPHGGHIINLSKMTRFKGIRKTDAGEWIADAEPGITLEDLRGSIARASGKEKLIWQPSPSEGSASIGGIIASGAFGMNICGCGATSDYVYAIEYVNRNGGIITLTDRRSIAKFLSETDPDRQGCLITSLSLILAHEPEIIWGTAFFFGNEDDALGFADRLEGFTDKRITTEEYIDEASIKSIEASRETLPAAASVPPVPDGTAAAVYIELEGMDTAQEAEIEDLMMEIAEAAAECGADLDTAWAFTGEAEVSKFHDFRHAVTESATQRMAAVHAGNRELHLISFDLREEGACFSRLMRRFRAAADTGSMEMLLCGSIGVSVIRAIIIPGGLTELQEGERIKLTFMQEGGRL